MLPVSGAKQTLFAVRSLLGTISAYTSIILAYDANLMCTSALWDKADIGGLNSNSTQVNTPETTNGQLQSSLLGMP